MTGQKWGYGWGHFESVTPCPADAPPPDGAFPAIRKNDGLLERQIDGQDGRIMQDLNLLDDDDAPDRPDRINEAFADNGRPDEGTS